MGREEEQKKHWDGYSDTLQYKRQVMNDHRMYKLRVIRIERLPFCDSPVCRRTYRIPASRGFPPKKKKRFNGLCHETQVCGQGWLSASRGRPNHGRHLSAMHRGSEPYWLGYSC